METTQPVSDAACATRPSSASCNIVSCLRTALVPLIIGVVLAAVVLIANRGTVGGIVSLGGDRLVVDRPALVVKGDGQDQQIVTVKNTTSRRTTILGFNATCSCVSIVPLPLTLEAGHSVPLFVSAQSTSANSVPIELFTDDAEQPKLKLHVDVLAAN